MARKLKKSDRFTIFHGSYSDKPPHEYDSEPAFHAGTFDAALDRLASSEQDASDAGMDINNPKMHAYEVHVQPSMMQYEDPYEPSHTPKNKPYMTEMQVNTGENWESAPQRILKYTNRFEDKGSTSYVIPKHFVEQGYVKYLGNQFRE